MPEESEILDRAGQIATEVLAAHAERVDREAAFPTESVRALAGAGLLGVLSAPEVGGLGLGLDAAAGVVERLARECGSTAMVVTMHYCGVAVFEKYGTTDQRRGLASGERFATLAFSESGSRSHFWAPVGTARKEDGEVRLDARKSWVTSAGHASDYVWSSKPLGTEGMSTLWAVPSDQPGLSIPGPFKGLGLRGNDSTAVVADGVLIPEGNRLGEDGKGFEIMMETVLPVFSLLVTAGVTGLMAGAVGRTVAHAGGTRFEHVDSALADLPTIRAQIARMQVATDMVRALLDDALAAAAAGREDAMLRILEAKAAAGESSLQVLDGAMRVCGGAAFRGDVQVERYFRDGRAANIMAPTTDQLYDFIGRAMCGLPLFG